MTQEELCYSHCKYDKHIVAEMPSRFSFVASIFGQVLEKDAKVWVFHTGSPESEEFIDFLDGNGYIIDRQTDNSHIIKVDD